MGRATDWRGIVAGAILLDMGLLLAATLAPGAGGLIIALPALISRYLSLLLINLGLRRPSTGAPEDSAAPFRWRAILPSVLLVYGCLSLIGLPLSPGFAGRWAQLAVIGRGGVAPVVLLVIALAAATYTIIRTAFRLSEGSGRRKAVVTRGEAIFALVVLGLTILLGLLPDLLTCYVSGMIGM
jgi:NADH:ubiquinone oxidoreductase subunit 2 (subunit N)